VFILLVLYFVILIGRFLQANQVQVLLLLYNVRREILEDDRPFRHYQSTRDNPIFIYPEECSELVQKTRRLMREHLDSRFFGRYKDLSVLRKSSLILEMQLSLHPSFKSLGHVRSIVGLCNRKYFNRTCSAKAKLILSIFVGGKTSSAIENLQTTVLRSIEDRVKETMLSFAPSSTDAALEEFLETFETPPSIFSSETMSMLDFEVPPPQVEDQVQQSFVQSDRINEEFNRWKADISSLRVLGHGKVENILEFWCRQEKMGNYNFLSKAARVIYAFPASSAQIERDFGVCGQIMTPQRQSIAPHNLDMCAFLNRNRSWVDITQTAEVKPDEIDCLIPKNLRIDLLQPTEEESNQAQANPEDTYVDAGAVDEFLLNYFSETL
jgi:hypothetical protein